MSILLAIAQTISPNAAPKSAMGIDLLVWSVWAVVSVIVARWLGAFRHASIVGPDRLSPAASAFDLLAILCFAFFLEVVVTKAAFSHVHPQTELSSLMAEAAGKTASGLAIVLACTFLGILGIEKLGIGARRTAAGVAAGVATLFILFPFIELTGSAVLGIEQLLHLHRGELHPLLQTLRDSHNQVTKTVGILIAVLVAPIAEELFFRGVLQTAIGRFCDWVGFELYRTPSVGSTTFLPNQENRVGTRWAAIIIVSFIFALFHLQPESFAPLFVLSVGLGYVYERTGNLWISMTSHALFNAAQILLLMVGSGG